MATAGPEFATGLTARLEIVTLTDLGILVGIGMEGQMERMNTRNLPFYAGTFSAHGLNREDAVKLITNNAAKILGIDNTVGTLEVGNMMFGTYLNVDYRQSSPKFLCYYVSKF